MNRQKRLLIILLGILLLAGGYAYLNMPRQERVSRRETPRPTATAVRASGETSGELAVRLDLLEPKKGESPGYKRDIFNFPAPPPPPPPPPPKPEPEPEPEPVVEVVEPVVPVEVQKELARFTFLGFLEKKGEKTIFLSFGDEIFLVKKDDVFGEEIVFRVISLTPEELTIRQEDDPRSIIIPLVEQAPLVASERIDDDGEAEVVPQRIPLRQNLPAPPPINNGEGRSRWPRSQRR